MYVIVGHPIFGSVFSVLFGFTRLRFNSMSLDWSFDLVLTVDGHLIVFNSRFAISPRWYYNYFGTLGCCRVFLFMRLSGL